jgi:hypothetical protein
MNFLRRRRDSADEPGLTEVTKGKRNGEREGGKDGQVSAYFASTRVPLADRHTNVQLSSHRVPLLKSDHVRADQERRNSSTRRSSARSPSELPIPTQLCHKARTASHRSKPSSYLHWSDTSSPGNTIATGELSRARAARGSNSPLKALKRSAAARLGHHGIYRPPEPGQPMQHKRFENTDNNDELETAMPRPRGNQKALSEEQEHGHFGVSSMTEPPVPRSSTTSPHIGPKSVPVGKGRPGKRFTDQNPLRTIGQSPHILIDVRHTEDRRETSDPITSSSLTKLLHDCNTACTTNVSLDVLSQAERPALSAKRYGRRKYHVCAAGDECLPRTVELPQGQDGMVRQYLPHHIGLWTTAMLPDSTLDEFMFNQHDKHDGVYLHDPVGQNVVDLQQPTYVNEYDGVTYPYREEEQQIETQAECSMSTLEMRSVIPYRSFAGSTRSQSMEGEFAGFWRPNRLY